MDERWMLEDQIRHNKRATVGLFITVFVILWLLVLAIGVVLNYPPILTAGFALIFGIIYLLMASGFSVEAILKSSRARPANPKVREEKLLLYKVEEMALAAGIPVPKVYVTPSPDINAFATGRKPEDSVIAVTQGALVKLKPDELEGVLAHEMSHILNWDIRIQTYSIALIGLIAMLAEMVFYSLFWGGRGRSDNKTHPAMIVIAIVLIIVAPLLSRLAHMAISRKREYLADATGARLTRNPEGLARALAKIGGSEPEDIHRGDKTVASLYFANPFKRVRKESLWSTHPPIDERIARLKRM